MNATTTTQSTSKSVTHNPVQIGKPEEKDSTKGFANLLSKTIEEAEPVAKKGKPQLDMGALLAKATGASEKDAEVKGKVALNDPAAITSKAPIDLTKLGEVEEDPMKKEGFDLGDLLAEVSHKSIAPEGSEVINLKTVLGAKNDDPDLINKDLIALIPQKDQKAAVESLIQGAKQLLTQQLESRIPKNRVPKTLKGLVEMALRFNISVPDVKLEALPQNGVTEHLIAALDTKKMEQQLPTLGAKVVFDSFKEGQKKEGIGKTSPLQKMLAADDAKVESQVKTAEAKKEDPLAKALASANKTASSATTVATAQTALPVKDKEEKGAKTDPKDLAKSVEKGALLDKTTSLDAQTAKTEVAAVHKQTKGSPLEQMLNEESKTVAQSETSSQETQQHTPLKNEAAQKAESTLNAKMVEARQLVSQLSADVKEAMENYKPPFTKLSMKLNPERLGDIDVVMVQRGNNVHINLSANNQALGLLQQNSQELKDALNSAGLGDASMNFSSNGRDRNPSQDQTRQHTTGEYYEEMARLDDIDLLEIVVPRYI